MGSGDRQSVFRPRGALRLLAVLACATALPATAQSVEDRFDRVTGERVISYTADGSRDTSRPVLSFQATLAAGIPVAWVNLAYVGADQGNGIPPARFGSCHPVEWFADGQPVVAATPAHQARVVDGEMIEVIDQQVTAEWAAAIAAAREVRYRVCRNDYALTPSDIEAFVRISAKLKNGVAAARDTRVPGTPAPAAGGQQAVEFKGMQWRPRSGDTLF